MKQYQMVAKYVVAGFNKVLSVTGFWSYTWGMQCFALIAAVLVGVFLFLGPLLLAGFRFLRSGDRPNLVDFLLIAVGLLCAAVCFPIMFELLNAVLEHRPGPIL